MSRQDAAMRPTPAKGVRRSLRRAAAVALACCLAGWFAAPHGGADAARAARAPEPSAGKSIFDDDWKPPPESAAPKPPAPAPAPPPSAPRLRPKPPARKPPDPPKVNPSAPSVSPPPAASPAPPAPFKLPESAAWVPAEKQIKEAFKAEYARLTAADRAVLARALLQEVPGCAEDPGAVFVLLREARDLAVAAGDVESAVEAARGMRGAFLMDAAQAKEMERTALTSAVRAMGAAPPVVATPAAARRAAELLLAAAERDFAAGDYAAAAQAAALLETPARRSGSLDFLSRARSRVAVLQAVSAEAEQVKTALTTLRANPADGGACLIAGRFYTFTLDRPDQGLSLLAKCSDPLIKAAAAKEVADPFALPAEQQAALADVWADAAKPQPATSFARDWMLRRALRWYDAALVTLEGTARLAADKHARDVRISRARRGGLLGEYFNGSEFERRVFTRIDPKLEFDWRGAPADDALPGQHFSVRWSGWIKSPAAGQYKLVVIHDDAVRVWLDGVVVVDKWQGGAGRDGDVVQMTGGLQEFKVEFSQHLGASAMGLGWRPGHEEDAKKTRAVPSECLYYDPPPPGPVLDPWPAVASDGQIVLSGETARMYGGTCYGTDGGGPETRRIRGWESLTAYAQWDFEAPAGEYEVQVAYGCAGGNAGGTYAVTVGTYRLTGTVSDTGTWRHFRTDSPGRVRLPAGAHTLRVRVVEKPKQALMDLRGVTLTPVK